MTEKEHFLTLAHQWLMHWSVIFNYLFYFAFYYFNIHNYTCYTGHKIIQPILRCSYIFFWLIFLMKCILPVVTTPWDVFLSISSRFIALKFYQCHGIKQGSLCSCHQLETFSKFQPPPFDHSTCQDNINPNCQCHIIQNILNITQNPIIYTSNPFKMRK